MSRQAILAFSAIGPVFINENGARQGNAGGTFIDETSGVTSGTRHQRQAHGATTRCRAQRRAGARCRRRR